jgi:hypothetical protein
MRYMFLIYSQESEEPLSPEEFDRIANGHRLVMADAQQRGIMVGCEKLKPTRAATTVRTKNGLPLTMDGPFAETKEQLAGYYILECKDLDEAIEWAKRIPTACQGGEGSVEIRPVEDLQKRE